MKSKKIILDTERIEAGYVSYSGIFNFLWLMVLIIFLGVDIK